MVKNSNKSSIVKSLFVRLMNIMKSFLRYCNTLLPLKLKSFRIFCGRVMRFSRKKSFTSQWFLVVWEYLQNIINVMACSKIRFLTIQSSLIPNINHRFKNVLRNVMFLISDMIIFLLSYLAFPRDEEDFMKEFSDLPLNNCLGCWMEQDEEMRFII